MPVPEAELSPAWQDAWEGYELDLQSLQRSRSTIASRRSNVTQLARHCCAQGIEPADVTKPVLARYLTGQYKVREGTGPQTLHRDLKGFFGWLAAEEDIPDPFEKVRRPQGKAAPVEVIAWDDIEKILKACAGKTDAETARNVCMVWMFLESGLRRFELAALAYADVDRPARVISVRKGKGNKPRTAVYGLFTAKALRQWLKHRGHKDGPLFTTFMGDGITPSGVSQLVKRVSVRSGVKLRPHMFRHTWADAMLDAGVQEHNLMKLAGWSSTEMIKVYGAARAEQRALEAARDIQVGRVLQARGRSLTGLSGPPGACPGRTSRVLATAPPCRRRAASL